MTTRALGIYRADPAESIAKGLWHGRSERECLAGPMLRASLEGLYDVTALHDALKVVEREGRMLLEVYKWWEIIAPEVEKAAGQ